MNHATRFTKLALLLIVAGALALAGCGGDDNGGLSAEDMARIDSAEAAAAAAMAAEATAKAAQMEAEADAAAAHAAQMTAEAEAMAAKSAQATAEANATAAMAAQAVAESDAATAKADLSETQEDLDAAEMALEAARDAETMAETALAVAQSEAMAAKEARDEAMAAQEKAEMAQKAAEMAQADAEKMADDYKMMYDEAKAALDEATDVDTVGTTVGAAARAVAMRIASSVTDPVKAAGAVSATQEPAKRAMMEMVKGGVSVKELKYTDAGMTFNVDQGAVTQLTHSDTADDMAPMVTGYNGAALDKASGGVMQEALIYTDVERSVTSFSAKYPYTHRIGFAADGSITAPDDTPDDGIVAQTGVLTHYLALVIPITALSTAPIQISATSNPAISFEHGLSSDLTMRTLSSASGDTSPTTIRGSYDGVPGQYVCVGECGLEWKSSAAGPYIALYDSAETPAGATLYFTADDRSELLSDPDYLTFGVWMMAQDGPAAGGLIRPIAMAGADAFGSDELAGLKGSATYTGAATGYYATRAAGSAEANSGRFTATATLKANFDAPGSRVTNAADADGDTFETTVGDPGLLGMLKTPQSLADAASPAAEELAAAKYVRAVLGNPGVSFAGSKIDNFMAEDGTMMEGWVVNLDGGKLRQLDDVAVTNRDATAGIQLPDLVAAQDIARMNAMNASTFEGATSGTGYALEWEGAWDASFHGTNMSTHPTGVVGTFQADAGMANPVHNEDGAINLLTDPGFAGVVGSFGARKQP